MIVPIPKDIYAYEHKVWKNFTMRQLICGGIALVLIFATFVPIFWKTGNVRLAAFLAAAVAFPFLYGAIWKKDGQNIENVLWYQYRHKFKFPQKRKFAMTNLYEVIEQNQKEFESAHEKIKVEEQKKEKKSCFQRFAALVKTGHITKQHPV